MKFAGKIGAFTAAVLILSIILLEMSHRIRFGHFFPFGLHADVVARKADFGIVGITKAFEPRLSNYGFTPSAVAACDFVEDDMSHGTEIRYTVEKWNSSTEKWERIFKDDGPPFCQPYPLGIIEGRVVTKRLWPGKSISAGEEATAARDVFAIGDKARFVVFARNGLAFPTAAFSIDEHPTKSDVPYRVAH